ncbi:MAG: hypothetical protein M1837_002779 [Sclerophora amabilis]|nr:MAG: hypothetical protein M1837_002779 [Sclerophora amabilis]
MSVGDGTWDSQRNSFLLPNLVGFNFDTMRYNGMGNRFAGMPGYHGVIRGHGIVAAITFLFIVPSSLLIARFYRRRPGWALRAHIWLQILTVILTTVIFILGWFAVGQKRSLTNPHHGIGLAIYIFVLVQAIWGWFVHKREKGRERDRIPLKLMLHQWFGRGIALLGIAQVALGLTLYGSPLVLFVLYALALFILIVTFFVLSYRADRRLDYDYHSSVGSRTDYTASRPGRRHSRLGRIAGIGAAGAALAALRGHRSRSRDRSRSRSHSRNHSRSRNQSRVDIMSSRRPSGSYIENEKYDDRRAGGGVKDRLLKIGAVAGVAGLAKRYFDGRRDEERETERRRHANPLGGAYSISEDSVSRVEEGRPLSRTRPPHQTHRRSHSLDSLSSRTSISGDGRGHGHKIRDGVATLGALGLMRAAFKSRRERKEQRRVEELKRQEIEEERLARQSSQRHRYTGDGFPRRGGRRGSLTASSDLTTTTDSVANPQPRYNPGIPPAIPPGYQPGAVAGAAAGTTTLANSSAVGTAPPIANQPIPMPPGPVVPQGTLPPESSASDVLTSTAGGGGGRRHRRHRSGRDEAVVGASGPSNQYSGGVESAASPPVSVKVKMNMHNNGRKVTLRRLPEEEAAAEREAKRRDRSRHAAGGRKHRRRGSVSSLSGSEGGARWRRTEDIERMQAEEMERNNQMAAQQQAEAGQVGLVPPPPIPGSVPAAGSAGSPGTYDGNTTEASAASRRQRRRAERAAQNYTRRPPGTVDYQ